MLVKFALGVSVAQAAGTRELLEALRCRSEVGWRPNEQGVIMDRGDDDLLVLELVGKRLEDPACVDNVEDDGEECVALDAATLAGEVLERVIGEAEVLRDLLLVVSDVLLEQDLRTSMMTARRSSLKALTQSSSTAAASLLMSTPSRVRSSSFSRKICADCPQQA